MAEHTEQTLEKLEQHDIVQKYLVHSNEDTEDVSIAETRDENDVRNHTARHAIIGHTVPQGKRLFYICSAGHFLTNDSF
jgi:hypothetical protein